MKAPAFQFYVADYMQDTRTISLAARGAWMDLLCMMWKSPNRGQITASMVGYARLFSSTVEQAKQVIDELTESQVCDSVTERDGKVTLTNRRMLREAKEREHANLRQKRYRSRHSDGESDADSDGNSNGKVTPPSSSSSTNKNKNTALRAVESPSAHTRLMTVLQSRSGAISDGGAQGQAVKWILEHGYSEQQAIDCLDALRAEDWRKHRVSWLTVKKEIGDWLSRRAAPKQPERPFVL